MAGTPLVEPTDRVWYVSYGSNMAAARLACYLEGGCPPGVTYSYPGARDTSPAQADAPVTLPGRVYFAGESPTWGGGVAYYDPDDEGPASARAHLVTAQQFADIASQEMRRPPEVDHDLTEVLERGRASLGPGRYETLLLLGHRDGRPMLTFTGPHRDHLPPAAPAPAYRALLRQGLMESHGWSAERADAYLDGLVACQAET